MCLPYHQVAVHCSHHRGEEGDMRGKEAGTGGRGEGRRRERTEEVLPQLCNYFLCVCVLSQ